MNKLQPNVEPFLNRLWQLTYARYSFRQVVAVCDFLLAQHAPEDDALYYPLMVAIHVVYARPFKHSRGGIKTLTEDVVPPELLRIHRQMIIVRDQVLAHQDANPSNLKGLPANHVRLIVRAPGVVNLGGSEITAAPAAILQFRELANSMDSQMTSSLAELAKEPGAAQILPTGCGQYFIDLERHELIQMPDGDA